MKASAVAYDWLSFKPTWMAAVASPLQSVAPALCKGGEHELYITLYIYIPVGIVTTLSGLVYILDA